MLPPLIIAWLALGCILLATVSLLRPSHSPDAVVAKLDAEGTSCVLRVACSIAAATGALSSVFYALGSASQAPWIVVAAWILNTIQCVVLIFSKPGRQSYSRGIVVSTSAVLTVVAQTVVGYQLATDHGGRQSQRTLEVVVPVCQGGISLSIALACAYLPRGRLIYRAGRPVDPEAAASVLHRFTFGWAKPLLDLGRQNVRINVADLPVPGEATTASSLQARLQGIFETLQQPLWKSLYQSHRRLFLWQWFLTVVMSVLSFGPQVCIYYLLRLLEQNNVQDSNRALIWIWAASLGAISTVLQTLGPRLMYLTFAKIEIHVRAQLSAVIFDKALKLDDAKGRVDESGQRQVISPSRVSEDSDSDAVDSTDDAIPLMKVEGKVTEQRKPNPPKGPTLRESKSSQQVLNLIAVDTTRIAEISSRQHIFIGSFFTFTIALVFLVRLIGWVSFSLGLLGPLLIVPLNMRASRAYGGAQLGIMKARDVKLKLLTEALKGIKQVKFTATESQWESKLMELRKQELGKQRMSFIWAICLRLLFHSSPIILAMISLSAYAISNGSLSASVAFTALGVFANLEFSVSVLPMAFMQLFDGLVSAKRIHSFLQMPEKKPSTAPGTHVRFKDATVSWPGADQYSMDGGRFCLKDITADFPQHALSVIYGPSGSGKTLLLAAIIGEAPVLKGSVLVPRPLRTNDRALQDVSLDDWILPGSLAYVSQIPWMENASIRDNIVFGLPMIVERYQSVLGASALRPDLQILPDGDLTEVGAQGINLSGGQRWRLTFARALYSRAETLVLDDIFSAVDSHVGAHLLQTLIGKLCQGRTRILATHHASRCLPEAAYAIRLGRNGFVDCITTTADHKQAESTSPLISMDDNHSTTKEDQNKDSAPESLEDEQMRKPKAFVQEESREEGAVKWRTYSQYLTSSGGFLAWVLVITLVVISQLALLGRAWWIKMWTASDEKHSNLPQAQDEHRPGHGLAFYLSFYIIISLIAALMEAVKCAFVYAASLRASRSLFRHLLHTVLRAKLRWLDTVPVGRILNRFTADFALVDTKIPGDAHTLLSSMFALGVVFTAGLMLSPYIAISSVALSLLTLGCTARYLPGAREVRRLESTTKSPILELCGTSLSGLGTIRAFGVTDRYSQRMKSLIDDYSSSGQAFHLITQWLAVRIGVFGALYALSVAVTIAALPHVDASLAGLALAFAMDYAKNMEEAVRRYSMLQVDMNSTERILEYAEMDHERDESKSDIPASWPSHGQVSFHNVFAAYAIDSPAILRGISVEIGSRQRIGIVGRTGAGKSSLALALFRFIELLDGTITIDGIDISRIGLKQLRQKMSIIPQDPVLFSGTIKSNLDPFVEYSDDDLRESLERVHLATPSDNRSSPRQSYVNVFNDLESPISEDGLNLSQGQRQLLCLARATLVQSRILVLDEATSAVDRNTDELIQKSIRESFSHTTLIVIAHRLSTVADFDRILVMDEGKIAEFGDPKALFRAKGALWRLVNDSSEYAQLLRILSS